MLNNGPGSDRGISKIITQKLIRITIWSANNVKNSLEERFYRTGRNRGRFYVSVCIFMTVRIAAFFLFKRPFWNIM